MDNYPPGAKDDPNAPYNEEEYNVDIHTIGENCEYIYIDSDDKQVALDGYDIYNNLFPAEYEDDSFKSARKIKGGVEIKTEKGKTFFIDDDEIILYFYTKYF